MASKIDRLVNDCRLADAKRNFARDWGKDILALTSRTDGAMTPKEAEVALKTIRGMVQRAQEETELGWRVAADQLAEAAVKAEWLGGVVRSEGE